MFNFNAKIFVFISLLMVFSPVIAGHATNLYDVEMPVVDESAATRWGAFKRGLSEVFIRISGDSIIMDKLKVPAPTAYVKQYSYAPVEEPTTNELGELLPYRIKIQYNAGSMESYLLENGFPVWGEHRPDVVVWLAVRDGRNEYVLKKNDKSLIKTAADEALARRGIPEAWPKYDAKDKKALSVADIRGGFKDPINSASKRYSRGPALTGSIIWNGSQWQSSWNLLMKSKARHWSLVDTDYNRLINKAVDQAADAMGVVFALHGSVKNENLATIQLDVQAVNSIEQYNRVETYLTSLRAVDSARPIRVDSQAVVFEVTLRSEKTDFLNAIKNDDEFIEVEKPKVEQQAVEAPSIDNTKQGDTKQGVEQPEKTVETQLTANQQDVIPMYYYKLVN
ncbi:hypothetical protein MNBD_GAMMA05-2346 [hydrothermal vent metagenome]|uniref:DUF2066 domain-containing protein n=1 Tax=hydrothermal vent metagenome TaxID=652676 RepID=A0A3B0WVB4_9ZZZZ